MTNDLSQILWNQFGGALEMLENAIRACPPELWSRQGGGKPHPRDFWYGAYHALFWTDYYFSETTEEDFRPPEPFDTGELDPDGVLPGRVYTREELLAYGEHVWARSRVFLGDMGPERARQPFVGPYKPFSRLEVAIYSTRHVQHHAAQLNLLLRQGADLAPDWVTFPRRELRA